ncbi:MAG: hypothetical protein GF350_13100 [Chitinivibrionales bacterium]|nr:hypothetical protein [Chitinivibrionales bacterium]
MRDGRIRLEFGTDEPYCYILMRCDGRVVARGAGTGDRQPVFDTRSRQNGIYLMKINGSKGRTVQRYVIIE